jgi:hypothetical protein
MRKEVYLSSKPPWATCWAKLVNSPAQQEVDALALADVGAAFTVRLDKSSKAWAKGAGQQTGQNGERSRREQAKIRDRREATPVSTSQVLDEVLIGV